MCIRDSSKRGDNRCIFDDDVANGLIEKAVEADGLVVGTPVFYAGANGALLAVLDRLFYACLLYTSRCV